LRRTRLRDGSTRACLIAKEVGIKLERRAPFAGRAEGLGYCACRR
jgi:hypothetical protein